MCVLMARLTSLSNIHGALFGSVLLPAASSTSCNQKASKQRFQQPSPAVNLLERERERQKDTERETERESCIIIFFSFIFFLGGGSAITPAKQYLRYGSPSSFIYADMRSTLMTSPFQQAIVLGAAKRTAMAYSQRLPSFNSTCS